MRPNSWSLPFLDGLGSASYRRSHLLARRRIALIILNQPFSVTLLECLWNATHWRVCADGGANRLYDTFLTRCDLLSTESEYLPDLIRGDLDSLRQDVEEYYKSKNVQIVKDEDQDSTDLMKCISSLFEKEAREGEGQYDIVILGGLSGRLDQTVHTLSCLHKLRTSRDRVFVVTDESIAWVLDSGDHEIEINHDVLGKTCGLLPVGIDSTVLTTAGLRWNLVEHESAFDGLVSTSNHLVPEEPVVRIKTTKPILWTAELRSTRIVE